MSHSLVVRPYGTSKPTGTTSDSYTVVVYGGTKLSNTSIWHSVAKIGGKVTIGGVVNWCVALTLNWMFQPQWMNYITWVDYFVYTLLSPFVIVEQHPISWLATTIDDPLLDSSWGKVLETRKSVDFFPSHLSEL